MEKIEKFWFWNLDWNLKILKYVTKIWNEKSDFFFIFKIWNFLFLKFEMKISVYIFLKNWPYHQMEMKKTIEIKKSYIWFMPPR
jgi:hypothetical protein